MSERKYRTNWSDRTHPLFAEVAEMIGCKTSLVMAATEQQGYVFAMATPRYPEDRTLLRIAYRRDADGILREVTREEDATMLDRMEAEIKARLERDR